MTAPASAPRVVSGVKALNCPSCGAPIALRSFGRAINVACERCGSILDAQHPELRVLEEHERRAHDADLRIPLGSRGTWHGTLYEVIGYQKRAVRVDDVQYPWSEYLLFNPVVGFRYLTEYNGHWNDVVVEQQVPHTDTNDNGGVTVQGERFRHFQSAQATVLFVLGEFPWQVRVNDQAFAHDYVAPPQVLSAEDTDGERTWSRGTYVTGAEVWKAFTLTGSPPDAQGVYLNQPNRWAGTAKGLWLAFFVSLLVIAALAVGRSATARRDLLFQRNLSWTRGDSAAWVSPVFTLEGGRANVEVTTDADVNNSWLYVNYALINDETGEAFDFGRDVGYWYGTDSDGSWTEGTQHDVAIVPAVPAGRWYLRVEPEGPPDTSSPIAWQVRVRRDVPTVKWWFIAVVLLGLPPFFIGIASGSFEGRRWAESDHAPVASDDSGDDDSGDDD